jgi:hypothetical protein
MNSVENAIKKHRHTGKIYASHYKVYSCEEQDELAANLFLIIFDKIQKKLPVGIIVIRTNLVATVCQVVAPVLVLTVHSRPMGVKQTVGLVLVNLFAGILKTLNTLSIEFR